MATARAPREAIERWLARIGIWCVFFLGEKSRDSWVTLSRLTSEGEGESEGEREPRGSTRDRKATDKETIVTGTFLFFSFLFFFSRATCRSLGEASPPARKLPRAAWNFVFKSLRRGLPRPQLDLFLLSSLLPTLLPTLKTPARKRPRESAPFTQHTLRSTTQSCARP